MGNATREPALESAVREGHAGAETVYADWLLQHGDPRGELARASDPVAHVRAHLGALAGHFGTEIRDLEFRNGFLRGASLRRHDIDSDTDVAALTRDFLALPVAMFVERLRFGLVGYEPAGEWTDSVRAVAASAQAPHVRSLRFDDFDAEEEPLWAIRYGDFSGVWKRLHGLEELIIRAGEPGNLGDLALPRLKRFARMTSALAQEELEAILAATWPQLEQLEIWFGDEALGAQGDVDALGGLLAGEAPATLRHLGLCNSMFAHELIEPLARSPLLPQLRVLDLSKSALTDDDVALFLDAAPRFAHLERLDLSECQFGEGLDELRDALPNARLDDQREGYGDGDRYVAVGE